MADILPSRTEVINVVLKNKQGGFGERVQLVKCLPYKHKGESLYS